MTDRKGSFIAAHAGTIVALLTSLATAAYSVGVTTHQVTTLEARVLKLETEGTSLDRESRWVLNEHAKQIAELRSDSRAYLAAISELKTQVGVVNLKIDTLIEAVRDQQPKADINQ